MSKTNLPKSVKKFICKEKARIRREVLSIEEQNKLISEIYQKFIRKEKRIEENPKFKNQNSK